MACLAGLGAFLVWLNFRTGISRAQVGYLSVFFFFKFILLIFYSAGSSLLLADFSCCE